MEEECMPGDQLEILASAFGQLVWLENQTSVHEGFASVGWTSTDVMIIITYNPASRGRICQMMSSTWQEKSVDVRGGVVLCPV